jgi:acyl carrier protein
MPEPIRTRLQQCFAAVFPNVTPSQITAASPQTVDAWDSVAHVTLMTVIEEEFGVELPVDGMEKLASFADVERYLESHGAVA